MHDISAGLHARMLLNRTGFRSTHSLGQNFLLDDGLLSHLIDVAGVGPDDRVLEIGPGAGVMTRLLAQRVQEIVAVEIDLRLEPILSEMLADLDNARVVYQDALKTDLSALLEGPVHVVANLPYYITADLIQKLLLSGIPLKSLNVMVQKEAAERMMSAPGDPNWCRLAALVQYFGVPSVLAEVPPEAFEPNPRITSVFMRVDIHQEKPVKPLNEALFLKTLTVEFAMRRKTLANNLKASFYMDSETAKAVILAAGLDERVRGEVLTLEQVSTLSDVIFEQQKTRK